MQNWELLVLNESHEDLIAKQDTFTVGSSSLNLAKTESTLSPIISEEHDVMTNLGPAFS